MAEAWGYTDNELLDILQHGKCRCGNPGLGLYECPVEYEHFNNPKPCNCCTSCRRKCNEDSH